MKTQASIFCLVLLILMFFKSLQKLVLVKFDVGAVVTPMLGVQLSLRKLGKPRDRHQHVFFLI